MAKSHDISHLRSESRRMADAKVKRFASGGTAHGDEAQDRKMIAKAISEHEAHDHPGEPKTKLKLKAGGQVEGHDAKPRMDRKGLARGGKAGKGKHTNVNVIVAPGAGQPHPPMPMAPAAGMAPPPPRPAAPPPTPAAPPPRPPMAPPPGAGMGPAPGAPMMRKSGGRTVKAGGGSGLGRLEHAHDNVTPPAGESSPETDEVEGEALKRGGKCR